MLIVKVFTNNKQIDEIAIQNVSEVYSKTEYQSLKLGNQKERTVACLFIRLLRVTKNYSKRFWNI
jgi:hypothetical protein